MGKQFYHSIDYIFMFMYNVKYVVKQFPVNPISLDCVISSFESFEGFLDDVVCSVFHIVVVIWTV